MNEPKQYVFRLDGRLFRAQRELLLKIADLVRRKQPYEPAPGDDRLLEGLIAMTNAISLDKPSLATGRDGVCRPGSLSPAASAFASPSAR